MPEDTLPADEQGRWEADYSLRVWDFELRKKEVAIKEKEASRNRWGSPLVLGLMAAAVAALGNAGVALLNGYEQRKLEESKAEGERILGALSGVKGEAGIENLKILVKAGLIATPRLQNDINNYVKDKSNTQRSFSIQVAVPPWAHLWSKPGSTQN